ncbi:hypothetical protein D3C87_2176560 [compost metagenome]
MPEPDGPTIAVVPPLATDRLTPLRTACEPKFLVTDSISRWLLVLVATDGAIRGSGSLEGASGEV